MNASKNDAHLVTQAGVGPTLKPNNTNCTSGNVKSNCNHSLELPSPECLLEHAEKYVARGFSVFPVTIKEADGSYKKAAVRWKHLQQRQPTQTELRSMFKQTNLTGMAVALGPSSGGLYCRDFDDPTAYQRWADAHPELAKLLPTVRAARAPHVYFCSTQVLHTTTYPDGELRGLGGYAILPPSVHQTGHVYDWANPLPDGPVPTVDAEAAGFCRNWGCTEGTERTEHTEENGDNKCGGSVDSVGSGLSGGSVHSGLSGHSVQEGVLSEGQLVAMATPDDQHQNHHRLFLLARGVRALEKQQERELSHAELETLFDRWYRRAEPFLLDGQNRDEYWFEFLDALEHVKCPLGEDVITLAWERAQNSKVPKVAEQFVHPQIRMLVSLCRELQRSAGESSFYLACRTVARLFHLTTHTTAALWLRGLTKCKIIRETEKGGPQTNKASRYKYLHPLDD